jgi:hypothetical protein
VIIKKFSTTRRSPMRKALIQLVLFLGLVTLGFVHGGVQPVQDKALKQQLAEIIAEHRLPGQAKPPAPGPSEPAAMSTRTRRDKREDHPGHPPVDDSTNGITIHRDWWILIPPIPVKLSDKVVIGRVRAYQPYFSADHSSIYTEYEIQVEDAIVPGERSLPLGTLIVGYREGGRISTFDNRVVTVRVNGQGYPKEGKDYVFFLKKTEDTDDFQILTAYAIRQGRVFPIDSRQFEGELSRLPAWGLSIEEFCPFRQSCNAPPGAFFRAEPTARRFGGGQGSGAAVLRPRSGPTLLEVGPMEALTIVPRHPILGTGSKLAGMLLKLGEVVERRRKGLLFERHVGM